MNNNNLKRSRLVTKLQLHCHDCKNACSPKNGDWHNGEFNQIFLCQDCGKYNRHAKPKLQNLVASVGSSALRLDSKPKPIFAR